MLRSVDGSSTIPSFSTPGPVTIGTLGSETITSNSTTVKTLNYFSTGASSLPATLGNIPFSIDMISLTMANNMAATHKPFGTQQVTTLDLASVNAGLKGFQGGFTDGRYVYFVPLVIGMTFSGLVARVDLQNFTTNGVTTLDLASVNPELMGFFGGFTDGRYGYFVPFYGSATTVVKSGLVARVDFQNFTTSGVTSLDLSSVDTNLRGFWGGFTDGRYGYFVPYENGTSSSGLIARVDLNNFATSGVTSLDLASVNAGLTQFRGGFTDGRYGYFCQLNGLFVRVDLQNFTTSGVTFLNLASVNANLMAFDGCFTDGKYGYLVPGYNYGVVARVDLGNFATGGVTTLDLTSANASLKGFNGGFTDGRYGYFVPNNNGSYYGLVARVDLQNFTTGGVTTLNLASVNAGLKGFRGGFTDGRYGYFVPHDGSYSGLAARVQITVPPYLYNGC